MSTLSTVETDIEKYGPNAVTAISVALAAIGVGGEPLVVLGVVEAVLKAFSVGVANGATPESIAADIAALQPAFAADDAAADAAVDAKFGKTGL